MPNRTTHFLCVALAGAGFVLGGCGDDDDKAATVREERQKAEQDADSKDVSPEEARAQVILTADAQGALKIYPDILDAAPGRIHVSLANPTTSKKKHAIAITGNGADTKGEIVDPAGSSELDVDVKPGTYELYCPVAGHRKGGMRSRLIIE